MKLFESDGVNVWVEGSKIVIADNQEREEFDDTPENRELCLQKARSMLNDWEAGR